MHEIRNPRASRSKANKRNGPPKGEPWVWNTMGYLESLAYRALTGNALKVLSRVQIEHMTHGGTLNGKLIVTHDQFEQYGVRLASVSAAIQECEYMGFLRVERGHFYKGGNEPNLYRLTTLPDSAGNPATNEWKSINAIHIDAHKAQKQARIAKATAKRSANRAVKQGGVVVPLRPGM